MRSHGLPLGRAKDSCTLSEPGCLNCIVFLEYGNREYEMARAIRVDVSVENLKCPVILPTNCSVV